MYRDLPYGCEIRDFIVFVNQFPVTVSHSRRQRLREVMSKRAWTAAH